MTMCYIGLHQQHAEHGLRDHGGLSGRGLRGASEEAPGRERVSRGAAGADDRLLRGGDLGVAWADQAGALRLHLGQGLAGAGRLRLLPVAALF